MATEKQIEANRINAQRSTGPKTAEGKGAVRFNALKHGLRVEAFDVLPNEDAGAFVARLTAWNRDCRPTTEAEAELVRQVVCLTWKMDRAARYEHTLRSKSMQDAAYECGLKGEDPTKAEAIASHDPSLEGDRLRRYQSSLQRDVIRTLAAFSKLQKENESRRHLALEDASSIRPDPLTPDPSADSVSTLPRSAAVGPIEPELNDLLGNATDHVTIKANPLHTLGLIHRITGGRTPFSMIENPPKGINPTPFDRISCERS